MKKHSLLIQFLSFCLMIIISDRSDAQNISASCKQYFIENKGQWPDEVLYLTSIGGMNAWIMRDGVVYDFFRTEVVPSDVSKNDRDDFLEPRQPETYRYGHVVKQTFDGTNADASATGHEKQTAYYNFFIGNDPSKWTNHVGLYSEILVSGVYPKIDVRYYFDSGSLRYDFVVHPGADVNLIKMKYDGADQVQITKAGELVIGTQLGDVRQTELCAYQEMNGIRERVKCRFEQRNDRMVGFDVKWKYKDEILIIDPIIWSTYLGGTSSDYAYSGRIDANQDIVVAGTTHSDVLPDYVGAYNDFENLFDPFPEQSYFVTKLDGEGTAMFYFTIIGGDDIEYEPEIELDSGGNIYLGGWTRSTDYPVTEGAFDETHNDGGSNEDIVVTKLSAQGDLLIFSTFLGSDDDDRLNDIYVNNDGETYLVGVAEGLYYPATDEAFDNQSISTDAVITKLNSAGSALVFSTFLGGSAFDGCRAIDLDAAGNIYVAGFTNSDDFPVTIEAYDTTFNGSYDSFVVKFDNDCSELIFATYFGGSNEEVTTCMTLDSSDNICFAGTTYSSDLPFTAAFDTSYNGERDVFLAKLSGIGSELISSTFVGGSNDSIRGLKLDQNENVCAVGASGSIDFPVTPNSISQVHGGDLSDWVVVKLSSELDNILYSSFIGGSGSEASNEIVFDGLGNAYIFGSTNSPNFPTTPGVIAPNFNGPDEGFIPSDAVILKMNFCPSASAFSNSPLCEGDTLTLTASGGENYSWTGPNGFTDSNQHIIIPSVTGAYDGTFVVTASSGSSEGLLCADTASILIQINPLPDVSLTLPDSLCIDSGLLTLTGGSPAGGTYSGAGVTANSFDPVVAGIGAHTIEYAYVDTLGCSNSTTAQLQVVSCVGIFENGESGKPEVYPNPVSDFLNLQSDEVIQSISIKDISGRVLLHRTVNSKVGQLDVRDLAAGLYLLELNFGSEKKSSAKFVVE